jgi:glycosyltransferase involved in cell wall biosynthesis
MVNELMGERLGKEAEVKFFNSALSHPNKSSSDYKFLKLLHQVKNIFTFIFLSFSKRPDALYIGLSGGYGQLFDCVYILTARLIKANIFIHHHSFAYLIKVNLCNKLCMKAGKSASHIVLSEGMGKLLSEKYRVRMQNITVLSNAAFLDNQQKTENFESNKSTIFTLGFLSNIVREKGIMEYFAVVEQLAQEGIRVRGLIAGPVAPEIKDIFLYKLATRNEIEYIGPVYGEAKERFYRQIDLLLFPTTYINEAEPITILEAMRHGVPTLATRRGCIPSMISAKSGAVFDNINCFIPKANQYIKSLINGEISKGNLSASTYAEFKLIHERNATRLDKLVKKIALPRHNKKIVSKATVSAIDNNEPPPSSSGLIKQYESRKSEAHHDM